jgi:hypothetical protein
MRKTVTNHVILGCSNAQVPENAFQNGSNVMETMIVEIVQTSQTLYAVSFFNNWEYN